MQNCFKQDIFHWFVVIIATFFFLYFQNHYSWLKVYPEQFIIPLSIWMDVSMDWFVKWFGWIFKSFSWLLKWPVEGVRNLLHFLPWVVSIFLFCEM